MTHPTVILLAAAALLVAADMVRQHVRHRRHVEQARRAQGGRATVDLLDVPDWVNTADVTGPDADVHWIHGRVDARGGCRKRR